MTKLQTDIDRLRQLVEHGRSRLNALRRGLEMARVQEALHRAGANGRRAVVTGAGALREAEQTLERIRQRQCKDQDLASAFDEIEHQVAGSMIDDRLADAGFGPRRNSPAADILARLKQKAAAMAALPAGPPAPSVQQSNQQS